MLPPPRRLPKMAAALEEMGGALPYPAQVVLAAARATDAGALGSAPNDISIVTPAPSTGENGPDHLAAKDCDVALPRVVATRATAAHDEDDDDDDDAAADAAAAEDAVPSVAHQPSEPLPSCCTVCHAAADARVAQCEREVDWLATDVQRRMLHCRVPVGASAITPRVFVGSAADAASASQLINDGFTLVVPCARACRPTVALTEAPGAPRFLFVPLHDSVLESIEDHFEHVSDAIDAELARDGRVLIHCQQGVSRSVALVMAWLMRREARQGRGCSAAEALATVRSVRPFAGPNPGFMRKLESFETSLLSMTK
jgi:hypothetical protein